MDSVRKLLENGIKDGIFPGAVLLVAKGGRVAFFQEAGDRSIIPRRLPMKKDTVFDLASLTKPLAATLAMMKLVEEGVIDLDQPLSELMPSASLGEKDELTPRLLLCHASGLVDWKPYYLKLVHHPIEARRELLREWIIGEPFAYPPKEGTLYSDLGFMLLEWVIEEKAGESLPRFVDRLFYGPLGLERTFFLGTSEEGNPPRPPFTKGGREESAFTKGRREESAFTKGGEEKGAFAKGGEEKGAFAKGRRDEGAFEKEGQEGAFEKEGEEGAAFVQGVRGGAVSEKGSGLGAQEFAATEDCPWRKMVLQGEVDDENAWGLGGYSGHAGLFSTAEDVHVITNMIREHYFGMRRDVLKPKTVREFLRRQNIVEGSDWALGWDTRALEGSSAGKNFSRESVGHTGFTGTSIWMDLEKDVVVILLTNRVHPTRSNDRIKTLRPKLHDAVMKELGLV